MSSKNKFLTGIVLTGALAMALGTNSYAKAGTIKGSAIRVRKEANTDSTVIDTYGDGEELEVLEKSGEWYKVTIDGKTGYVYQDYINVDEDSNEEENNEQEKKEEENNIEKPKTEETKTEKPKEEEKNTGEPKEENNKPEEQEKANEQSKNEETLNKSEENKDIKLGTIKSATTQKIYILPNIGSSIIGEVKKDSDINIIQEVNGWAYISTDTLSGWVRYDKMVNETKVSTYNQKEDTKEDIQQDNKQDDNKEDEKKSEETKKTETNNKQDEDKKTAEGATTVTEKTAYISEDTVNFREKASSSADVIKTLKLNTEVIITAEDDEWYKVKIGNEVGYVSKQFVSESKVKETTSRSSTEKRTAKTSSDSSNSKVTGQDIVDYAMEYLGYPYVYAAESPSVGFDCSGLVWYVYKHFGYNVSRTSAALANDGETISNKKDLKPGDILIFLAYNDYSRVGHVGIYIGNNEFIHANDESTGIIITSLDYGKYPERFVSGRRIIK